MAVAAHAALDLADSIRVGGDKSTPFELWQAAGADADGSTRRRELYRHAMIHAGYLVTGDGHQYERCPVCRCSLAL